MENNWFDNVEKSGGNLKEQFSQTTDLKGSRANLCQPLSILWLSYKPIVFKEFIKTNANIRNIEFILDTIELCEDLFIDVYIKRQKAINDFCNGILNPARWKYKLHDKYVDNGREIPDDIKQAADCILETMPADNVNWPKEIDSLKITEEERNAFVRVLRFLEPKPPHNMSILPWEELIQYKSINKLVPLFSRNKLLFDEHKNLSLADEFIEEIAEGDVYKLLTIYEEIKSDSEYLFKGHMMAMHFEDKTVTFFDPNCGVASFPDKSKFIDWFCKNREVQYSQWNTGIFLKTFGKNNNEAT